MDIKKNCETCGAVMKRDIISGQEVFYSDCDCAAKEYLRREQQAEIRELYLQSGMPQIYMNDKMTDWIKVPGTEDMENTIRAYVKNIDEKIKNREGLFIAGNVGTGKTRMLCYVANIFINKCIRTRFVSSDQLTMALTTYKNYSQDLIDYINVLSNTQLLILDDFGESKIADWKHQYLTNIINERYYKKKITFFSTMKTLAELQEIVGEHIMSRVMQMCEGNIVEVKSTRDMRLKENRASA